VSGIWSVISAGLAPAEVLALLAVSGLGSFITAALGIGGGALALAVIASILPPVALIPVHGAVQVGSNLLRMLVLMRHVYWPPMLAFGLGTIAGASLGGVLVIDLPSGLILVGVGCFVIWTVLAKPPAWITRWPGATGAISSLLTMFFGATGPFVAGFLKTFKLERQAHVATQAAMMTAQHLLKIIIFALLGFSFAPWIGLILAMTLTGLFGTLFGRMVLVRLSDQGFKRALDIVLFAISLHLIWSGLRETL